MHEVLEKDSERFKSFKSSLFAEEFGGVRAYLESIGFTEGHLRRLRRELAEDVSWLDGSRRTSGGARRVGLAPLEASRALSRGGTAHLASGT